MRLRALLIVLGCAGLVSVASADDGAPKKGRKSKPGSVSECVSVETQAIYGAYGYDHHVILHNGCDKTVRCEVTTSSNPDATTVTLVKNQTQDLLMFRASPAREVSANVKCVPADD